MSEELDEKELLILELIRNAPEPIGSWYIVNYLNKRNIQVSSATVGRVLNKLDGMGYLQKEKFRGRVLTAKGLQVIKYNKRLKDMVKEQHKITKLIDKKLLEDLLVVLEARRAVEGAAARMAAIRATPEDIATMEQCLNYRYQNATEKNWISGDNLVFHKSIAKAAKNNILESFFHQLAILTKQSKDLELLCQKTATDIPRYHESIMEAIKDHNPEAAEKAMAEHIESLIDDINAHICASAP